MSFVWITDKCLLIVCVTGSLLSLDVSSASSAVSILVSASAVPHHATFLVLGIIVIATP
jgi:hypothetical protein